MQPYVREPLAVRREVLKEHFQVVDNAFQFATAWDADNVDRIQEFLELSIERKQADVFPSIADCLVLRVEVACGPCEVGWLVPCVLA